jgi:2-polyprenyl-3-methyl-5-hydroxy-6-metoxy-1,4-benzoquinol methylase
VFDEAYFKHCVAKNPPRGLRFYARTVERHLAPSAPRRIHDVGCAFGRFLGSLDSSWDIFGSDVSEFAVGRAARENPRGMFRVARADAGQVFGEPFGVVTAFDVIEHVPDPDAVGRSVIAQLVDGGCFVFVVPVYDGLSGPLTRLLDRDPTHLHKWPRQRWLDWTASRFALVEWKGILRYLLPGGYYVHLVTEAFRHHTPAIIVVARKG